MASIKTVRKFIGENIRTVVNVTGVVIVYLSAANASLTNKKLSTKQIELNNVQQEFSYLKDSLQEDTWLTSVISELENRTKQRSTTEILKNEILTKIEKSNHASITAEFEEKLKNKVYEKSNVDDKVLEGFLQVLDSRKGSDGAEGSDNVKGGRMM